MISSRAGQSKGPIAGTRYGKNKSLAKKENDALVLPLWDNLLLGGFSDYESFNNQRSQTFFQTVPLLDMLVGDSILVLYACVEFSVFAGHILSSVSATLCIWTPKNSVYIRQI